VIKTEESNGFPIAQGVDERYAGHVGGASLALMAERKMSDWQAALHPYATQTLAHTVATTGPEITEVDLATLPTAEALLLPAAQCKQWQVLHPNIRFGVAF